MKEKQKVIALVVMNDIIKNSNFKAILGACWLAGTKDLVVTITEAQKWA